jgi:hypothetical protein
MAGALADTGRMEAVRADGALSVQLRSAVGGDLTVVPKFLAVGVVHADRIRGGTFNRAIVEVVGQLGAVSVAETHARVARLVVLGNDVTSVVKDAGGAGHAHTAGKRIRVLPHLVGGTDVRLVLGAWERRTAGNTNGK